MTPIPVFLASAVIVLLPWAPQGQPTDVSGVYKTNLVLGKALTASKGLPFRLLEVQAASSPADFTGTYEATSAANKALTESKGLEYRVGGAGPGPVTGQPPAPTHRTLYVVTQTASTLTIERRVGPSTTRTVHRLDGSESVNTSSVSSTRTRAIWKGRSLVISGTMSMEINGGDLVESSFVSTYTRMPNGDIHVETRSRRAGSDERVNWLALVRQQ